MYTRKQIQFNANQITITMWNNWTRVVDDKNFIPQNYKLQSNTKTLQNEYINERDGRDPTANTCCNT